jgi:hypothetical protein
MSMVGWWSLLVEYWLAMHMHTPIGQRTSYYDDLYHIVNPLDSKSVKVLVSSLS